MSNWRARLRVHPAIPPMSPEELNALDEDIRKKGLVEKIEIRNTPEGLELIDGRCGITRSNPGSSVSRR
jgi:ParB-like chromosome segregation protein Spo0J